MLISYSVLSINQSIAAEVKQTNQETQGEEFIQEPDSGEATYERKGELIITHQPATKTGC